MSKKMYNLPPNSPITHLIVAIFSASILTEMKTWQDSVTNAIAITLMVYTQVALLGVMSIVFVVSLWKMGISLIELRHEVVRSETVLNSSIERLDTMLKTVEASFKNERI